VPEAGIEPARPLLTKAADFKIKVPISNPLYMRLTVCLTFLCNRLCNASVPILCLFYYNTTPTLFFLCIAKKFNIKVTANYVLWS